MECDYHVRAFDLAAAIRDELDPLKKGAAVNLDEAIGWAINAAANMKAYRLPPIQKWALAARRALTILRKAEVPAEYFESLRPLELTVDENGKLIQPLNDENGKPTRPRLDFRFDNFKYTCAFQAVVLIENFSEKPPVTSEAGNIHNISKLVLEHVTGQKPTETGLLGACREALEYRESSKPPV